MHVKKSGALLLVLVLAASSLYFLCQETLIKTLLQQKRQVLTGAESEKENTPSNSVHLSTFAHSGNYISVC